MKQNSMQIIRAIWEDRVRGKPIFHGMSSISLSKSLDPAFDPHAAIRPALYRFLGVLEGLVKAGFELSIEEEHFGKRYSHDLRLIIAWTRNDLDNPGIDFTTSYNDACDYADCCQGSQLKENFKYITDHLPERKDNPIVRDRMGDEAWRLVDKIRNWIAQDANSHRGVVLCVDRSCPSFDPDPRCQPVGSLLGFSQKVQTALCESNLSCTAKTLAQVLPSEEVGFTVRMYRPLAKKYIMRVEEVTPEKSA